MSERKIYTTEQIALLKELTETHGLDVSQISFEGKDATPIFDYEAVCALSLKLTDIKSIESQLTGSNAEEESVSAICTVTLPDGRTRSVEDSACLHEKFGDGKVIDSIRLAGLVAQARAVRRGIRSVGVNLFRAHQNFIKSGQAATAHTNYDPRQPEYQEIHAIAAKIGLIVNADKSQYQQFIAELYDGRTSAKELDNLELRRLKVALRAMSRLNQPAVARAA